MSSPSSEDQRPPWDDRLLEWMSRDSGRAGPKSYAELYYGLSHGLVVALTAAITGSGYWIAVAIVLALTFLGVRLRRRRRNERADPPPARTSPNPFGS